MALIIKMLPASSSPRCSPRRFGQAKVHTLEDKERERAEKAISEWILQEFAI
jgi:hypothetical protein